MRRSLTSLCVALAGCAGAKAPSTSTCPPAAEIRAASDVARLAGCARFASLTVRTAALVPLASLRVATVTGALTIGPTVALEELSLSVREVGTLHLVGNGLLQGVFLRQLERADAIVIDGNPSLTTIALPRLASARSVRVTDNASLELLDLGAIARVDALVVSAPRLKLLEADALAHAGRVELAVPALDPDRTAALTAIAAP